MSNFDFSHQSDGELLATYSELMEELRRRQVVRTSNNPAADYAEKIAMQRLTLIQVGKEQKGFDAVDAQGCKYQIKGRRLTRHNSSRQLSVIRNLNEHLFDYLVAVIFDEVFAVQEIWKIPHRFIVDHSTFSQHQNGHILFADPDVLAAGEGVTRVQ